MAEKSHNNSCSYRQNITTVTEEYWKHMRSDTCRGGTITTAHVTLQINAKLHPRRHFIATSQFSWFVFLFIFALYSLKIRIKINPYRKSLMCRVNVAVIARFQTHWCRSYRVLCAWSPVTGIDRNSKLYNGPYRIFCFSRCYFNPSIQQRVKINFIANRYDNIRSLFLHRIVINRMPTPGKTGQKSRGLVWTLR